MPSIAGIRWERPEQEGSVTYPCRQEGDPGEPILFRQDFPTPDGRARFVPSPFTNAAELPDDGYPYALITGHQLEHWHTGAMTRRATVLDALEPAPMVNISPDDLDKLNAQTGSRLKVISRRGEIEAIAKVDAGLQPGQVFLPFCYHEAAANLLTIEALDPYAKIPEFKFCAVKLATVKE